VLYELERRGLIQFERLDGGRLNMKGRTVKQWVEYAVKIEKQANRVMAKVS